MGFFNICPRDKRYLDYYVDYVPLNVIMNDGIEISPDFEVKITDLNKGQKHFKIHDGKGDSFKISVIIKKEDVVKPYTIRLPRVGVDEETWDFHEYRKQVTVTHFLNYLMRNGIPVFIDTDAISLVNKSTLWLITESKTWKQNYHGSTVWDLTFTKYTEVKYAQFKADTPAIKKALTKKTSASAKKKTTVKTKTTARQELKKCNLNQLKYSKTKKVVKCVTYMQTVLYGFGFLKKSEVDGWFGSVTLNAVKKFQKKFHVKYKLKVTGTVDKNTLNALVNAPVK